MYSVIISSIGRYEYIYELLDSIQNQKIKSDDIILILDKKCFKDKEIKILNESFKNLNFFFEDCNLSQKRNLGVNLSKNNIIFFSDDDDIWYPDKVEQILPFFQDYDVITHNFDKFGNELKKNCSKLGHRNKKIFKIDLCYGENIFGGGSSIVAKKNILLRYNFNTNLELSEDFEWWIRVILADIKIFYISKSLVGYRSHNNNMTLNRVKIYISSIFITSRFVFSSFYGICMFSTSLLRNFIKLILVYAFKK